MKEKEFLTELEELALLNQTLALLDWDSQTGMPETAAEERGAASGYLSGLAFEKQTSSKIKEALDYFDHHADELSEVGKAAYHVVKKDYDELHAIPKELMVERSRLYSEAHSAWLKARETKNFADFEQALAENIRITKELVPYYKKDEATDYDVLLNMFEPGMTTAVLDAVFAELKEGLVKIRQVIAEKGSQPDISFKDRKMTKNQQKYFVKNLVAELGFDFNRGRLDDTVHPFATRITRNDVRITTRWNEQDFTMGIFGVIHESGHGIYEQSIAEKYNMTPVYDAPSMGIHESQSLFYEIIIGSKRSFWKKQYPVFQAAANGTFDDIDFETFYRSLKATAASLIRIEADSLTYPLHIIIRYELEKALFNDDLAVADLPKAWNDKYEEYLGIRPENDLVGVLQDVHWSGGMFGYFPSYALGYMYAAQLLHSIEKNLAVDTLLEQGDYAPIKAWLTEHIHQFGRSKTPSELIEAATGETLNPQYLLTYLTDLYEDVYQIKG